MSSPHLIHYVPSNAIRDTVFHSSNTDTFLDLSRSSMMDEKPAVEVRETSIAEGKFVDSDGVPAMEAVGTSTTTTGLQRKLQARHIQMIAIGSNIGTGLFIGSGKALHTGGPTSLVLAFVLIAISLTIMMQCLGEMAVVLPVSGSFTRYATRFYDPALGFAMGWQYWLAWVAVFGAEASAFVVSCNPLVSLSSEILASDVD